MGLYSTYDQAFPFLLRDSDPKAKCPCRVTTRSPVSMLWVCLAPFEHSQFLLFHSRRHSTSSDSYLTRLSPDMNVAYPFVQYLSHTYDRTCVFLIAHLVMTSRKLGPSWPCHRVKQVVFVHCAFSTAHVRLTCNIMMGKPRAQVVSPGPTDEGWAHPSEGVSFIPWKLLICFLIQMASPPGPFIGTILLIRDCVCLRKFVLLARSLTVAHYYGFWAPTSQKRTNGQLLLPPLDLIVL